MLCYKQVPVYECTTVHRSGTNGCCYIFARQTLHFHLLGGSTARCCVKDVMAAILKFWHQIKTPTETVDAYSREEHSWQISSRSDLKGRSLRLFEEVASARTTSRTRRVAIWDQFLILKRGWQRDSVKMTHERLAESWQRWMTSQIRRTTFSPSIVRVPFRLQ